MNQHLTTMKKIIIFGEYTHLVIGHVKLKRLSGHCFVAELEEKADQKEKFFLLGEIQQVLNDTALKTLPIRRYDAIAYVGSVENNYKSEEFKEISQECKRTGVNLVILQPMDGEFSLTLIYEHFKKGN